MDRYSSRGPLAAPDEIHAGAQLHDHREARRPNSLNSTITSDRIHESALTELAIALATIQSRRSYGISWIAPCRGP